MLRIRICFEENLQRKLRNMKNFPKYPRREINGLRQEQKLPNEA